MKRPMALLLIGLLFLCGAVVGIVGTHLYYGHRLRQPGGLADLALQVESRRLTRQLDLRPDQQEALAAIVADTREEITGIRHDVVGRLRTLRDRATVRLEAVLDAEQKEKLHHLRQGRGRAFEDFLGE